MKIHNQSIKRFMGISAATLLLLSVGGGAINATNNNTHADTFNNFVKQMSNERPTKSDIADEKVTYNNVLKDSIKHPKEMKANETILQDNSLFHKKAFERAVKQGIKTNKNKITRHKNNHKDSFDKLVDQVSKEGPSKSDIADEQEQYDNAFNDAVKHPKELRNDELTLQDNTQYHKNAFEKAVKQDIKAKRHKANKHKNTHEDNFDKILDKASKEGPSKSDIAQEQMQYNYAFKDAVKHPKELKNDELTLQYNSLFHKKSFEKAVRQGIHKKTLRTKRNHKIKRPKWKQVKNIKNSLKRINHKISRITHHKYRTKRTKRNARRTLNYLKQQLRNDSKQLNQLTHKHSTKRHKKTRKHTVKRHRTRRYQRHAKNRK